MRDWRLSGRAAVAAIIIVAFLAGPARAGDTHWIHDPSTPGDWFDPSNWDPSAPGVMDAAFFDFGGTAVIAGGSVRVASLMTGVGGAIPGSVIQSGGTATVMSTVDLGFAAGKTGTYDLSSGSLTAHDECMGYLGTGRFAQSGGTHLVQLALMLGFSSGATGIYDLGAGSLRAEFEHVGAAGIGTFTQSDGVNSVSSLDLGVFPGGSGAYALTGGSLGTGTLYVGRGGAGGFIQTGGTNLVGSTLYLATTDIGTGSYELAAGSLASLTLSVGAHGTGSFTQTGGINTNKPGGSLVLGQYPGSFGSYCLSGGSLRATNEYVGVSGAGTFTQSGGTNMTWSFALGSAGGAAGTYRLSGGSLATPETAIIGLRGMGRFEQSGGTFTGPLSLSLGYQAGGTGEYDLTDGRLSAWNLFVGFYGTGRFTQSGGTNLVGSRLELGSVPSALGTYHLSGGSLHTPLLVLGESGQGTFTQTGGTAVVASQLYMEREGSFNLSGGSLLCNSLLLGWEAPGSVFAQSGGTSVILNGITIGTYLGSSGTLRHSGGLLDARGGSIRTGTGTMDFRTTGGTFLADEFIASRGTIAIGRNAAVTVSGLELTDSASAETTLSFELHKTRSAFISGLGDPSSAAVIGEAGDHTLDLQTYYWRPREGQTFHVLRDFATITGSFDDITTNISGGQQVDPNTLLPIPLFVARIQQGLYDPMRLAVTFQGLSAGDANGDHAVDGGDLAVMGGNWMQTGMGWGDCDFNGDGCVDGGDIALIGGNWMWTLPPAPGAPLPEPASLALLVGGSLALIRRRR